MMAFVRKCDLFVYIYFCVLQEVKMFSFAEIAKLVFNGPNKLYRIITDPGCIWAEKFMV